MTDLEDRLNLREPYSTAALEIYYRETLAGTPPTDRELIEKVERAEDWILYYSRLDYPQKCLFNKGLLLRASSDRLSDDDVWRAQRVAEAIAVHAMDEALHGRGKTRRRPATGIAQHLKTEVKAALLLVVDQYGVPRSWRPVTDEPDSEAPVADDDSYEDAEIDRGDDVARPTQAEGLIGDLVRADRNIDWQMDEDAESRRSGGRSGGGSIENLADESNDEEYEPLSPWEWVQRPSAIQNRTLSRQFRNLMAQEDAPESAEEWFQRNRAARQMASYRYLVQQWTAELREAQVQLAARSRDLRVEDHKQSLSAASRTNVLDDGGANAAVDFKIRSFNALTKPIEPAQPKLVVLEGRREERLAKTMLSEVNFGIWQRRKDGYGSVERHMAQLAEAGIHTFKTAAAYRQRRRWVTEKVADEMRRQDEGVTPRRQFAPDEELQASDQ
jgi:hypothetical protein